jgi:predicted metal-dependent HD superfamily phosphohydrolase
MPPQDDYARFLGEWERLMDACKARTEPRKYVFAQIVAAYSEPHRYYHNLSHIINMLDQLLIRIYTNPESERLQLATWYHDVVYDPRSSENESRSAAVAENSLRELGLAEDDIARVRELILMTKDHQTPPEDKNALIFLDADLSILGMIPPIYSEYAEAIRQEYAWVSDRDYYPARRTILQGFLRRPMIYRSHWFHQGPYEETARANLTAEITQIDDILRALPS